MTNATIALAELAEKGSDVDMLRQMVQFMARRMMDMDVESLCGAGYDEKSAERLIAIIAYERLYLKVDAQTRPNFEAAGCAPFVYDAAGRAVSLGYFSAPDEAIESPPLMQPWARLALAAALRARAAKPPARSPVRKARPRSGSASSAPKKL